MSTGKTDGELTPIWHWAFVATNISQILFHIVYEPAMPRQEVAREVNEWCLCNMGGSVVLISLIGWP